MIDIHTHILPGIDDGAADIAESLAMARIAVGEGVTTMLTTSHSAEWFRLGPLPRMLAAIEPVQQALDAARIPLTLAPGMEIFMTPDTPADLAAGRAWSLAHSRYLLVELPFQPWPAYTDQVLFELQVAGYIPILAHPERYIPLQQNPGLMYPLAERGILGQVTGEALTGRLGRRIQQGALSLVDQGMVKFIASDGHGASAQKRQPVVAAGLAVASERIGAAAAQAMLTSNPQHILDNKPLAPTPQPLQTRRSFFSRLFGPAH
jgi:protein-tyrosine phosphatase